MMHLRQNESTAILKRIPFFLVDDTDGKTPETGVTITTGELRISKNGGAWANTAGAWTEVGEGLYHYAPTTGELDTVGFVCVKLVKTGIRTNPGLAQVKTDDPYKPVNIRGLVATNGGNTATTFCTNLASATTDIYKFPMLCRILTGTLAGATRQLAAANAFNGSTKFLTMAQAFTSTPADGVEFELISE